MTLHCLSRQNPSFPAAVFYLIMTAKCSSEKKSMLTLTSHVFVLLKSFSSLWVSLLPHVSPAGISVCVCPILNVQTSLYLSTSFHFFAAIVHFYKRQVLKNKGRGEWGRDFSVVWFSIWAVFSVLQNNSVIFSTLFFHNAVSCVVFPPRMTTSKAGLLPSL